MKKIATFLSFMLMLIASISFGQSTTKYVSRNVDERIAQVKVTTDSTLTYIDSIPLTTNQTGIVRVSVIGYAKDTAYSIRGEIVFDFNKRRGTLTIGTITESIPI